MNKVRFFAEDLLTGNTIHAKLTTELSVEEWTHTELFAGLSKSSRVQPFDGSDASFYYPVRITLADMDGHEFYFYAQTDGTLACLKSMLTSV